MKPPNEATRPTEQAAERAKKETTTIPPVGQSEVNPETEHLRLLNEISGRLDDIARILAKIQAELEHIGVMMP